MKHFILLLLILGLTSSAICQDNCSRNYTNYLNMKLYRNTNMKLSPKNLIEEYNSFYNCPIDEDSRIYIEKVLHHFVALDSLHCLYKENNNPEILNYIDKHIPDRDDKIFEVFNGLKRVLTKLAQFQYFTHCDSDLPEIKAEGLLIGETRKEPSKDISSSDSSIIASTGKDDKSVGAENVESSTDPNNTDLNSTVKPSDKTEIEKKIKYDPINTNVSFNDLFLEDPKIYLTDDKSVFLEFCFVNKGSFNLGITSSQYSDVLINAGDKAFELNIQDEVTKPDKRYVEISESFQISKFELSRGQFDLIMNGITDGDKMAKSAFSEKELEQLLDKLNAKFPNLYFDIPTEVEWEFAAKGSSENFYMSTNDYDSIDDKIVVNDSSGIQTIYPEECLLSPVSACNMIGNVKEICKANHEYYTSEFNRDANYVARGGSYIEDRFTARTTSRHLRSNIKGIDIGIRLIIKKKK